MTLFSSSQTCLVSKGDFIAIDYNFTYLVLFTLDCFLLLRFYYQNSFHYAITSDAVIFEHSFYCRVTSKNIDDRI